MGHWYVMIGVTQALMPPDAMARMTREIAKGTMASPESRTEGAAAATRMTWPDELMRKLLLLALGRGEDVPTISCLVVP